MPNTYTQLYVQIIFVVKDRANLIAEQHRKELEKYICGTIKNKKSKPLAVYCNPDHTHAFIGLNPAVSVSEIARDIKANSSRFINDKKWMKGRFNWQDGYGAFTYSKSHKDNVVRYVLNQPVHHKKKTFREEYVQFLQKFEIDYDEKYLF